MLEFVAVFVREARLPGPVTGLVMRTKPFFPGPTGGLGGRLEIPLPAPTDGMGGKVDLTINEPMEPVPPAGPPDEVGKLVAAA